MVSTMCAESKVNVKIKQCLVRYGPADYLVSWFVLAIICGNLLSLIMSLQDTIDTLK